MQWWRVLSWLSRHCYSLLHSALVLLASGSTTDRNGAEYVYFSQNFTTLSTTCLAKPRCCDDSIAAYNIATYSHQRRPTQISHNPLIDISPPGWLCSCLVQEYHDVWNAAVCCYHHHYCNCGTTRQRHMGPSWRVVSVAQGGGFG